MILLSVILVVSSPLSFLFCLFGSSLFFLDEPLAKGLSIFLILGGTSLVEQWIRLHAPNAEGLALIPGQGTRYHMHAATRNSHAITREPSCRD